MAATARDFDLGHLMAVTTTGEEENAAATAKALLASATADVQALLGELFQLPSVTLDGDGSGAGDVAQSGSSMFVQLPKPEFKLPRAQPPRSRNQRQSGRNLPKKRVLSREREIEWCGMKSTRSLDRDGDINAQTTIRRIPSSSSNRTRMVLSISLLHNVRKRN